MGDQTTDVAPASGPTVAYLRLIRRSQIVAAGCQLVDRCRSEQGSLRPGQQIPVDDPRVSNVLRRLGAQQIWAHRDCVEICTSSRHGRYREVWFQILREPSQYRPKAIQGVYCKGNTRFTDQLWSNE
jgi:hypothetical protein